MTQDNTPTLRTETRRVCYRKNVLLVRSVIMVNRVYMYNWHMEIWMCQAGSVLNRDRVNKISLFY